MSYLNRVLLGVFLMMGFISCGNYSFTGASIGSDTKTFSVDLFSTSAALAPPSLSQTFTESLRDLFQTQTSLSLVNDEADLQFNGTITGYNVRPVAVQGDEIAAKNRLTITVRVNYINTKNDDDNFDRSFNRFFEFDNSQDLSSVQDDLIKQITDQLVQDVFNESVGNW